jgi:hypothetical protein
MTRLTSLTLDRQCSHIDDHTLEALARNLRVLRLENGAQNWISDEGVRQLRHLHTLALPESQRLTGGAISRLTALTSLDLSHAASIEGTALALLTRLTDLDLTGNACFDDDGVSHLISLRTLNLSYNHHISGAHFSRLTALTQLNLSGNHTVCDYNVRALASRLRRLALSGTGDVYIALMSRLTRLETLVLETGVGASTLAPLTGLQNLNVVVGDECGDWRHAKKNSLAI